MISLVRLLKSEVEQYELINELKLILIKNNEHHWNHLALISVRGSCHDDQFMRHPTRDDSKDILHRIDPQWISKSRSFQELHFALSTYTHRDSVKLLLGLHDI